MFQITTVATIIIDTKTLVTIEIEVTIAITILAMIPLATIVVEVTGGQIVAVQHIATSHPEHDLDFMMTMKGDIMKKI